MYGLSTLGFVAAALTLVNLLFAFFFLPESSKANFSIQTNSDGYWRRLGSALTKPLIGAVFLILFVTTFAFSAIPVIVPLLGIAYFGFMELEMSYFFYVYWSGADSSSGHLDWTISQTMGGGEPHCFFVSNNDAWDSVYVPVFQHCRLHYFTYNDIGRYRYFKYGSS